MTLTYPVLNRVALRAVRGHRRREGAGARRAARRRPQHPRRPRHRRARAASSPTRPPAGVRRLQGYRNDGLPAQPGHRNALHQHHPHAVDRRGAGGQLRPSGHADGARAAGLRAVEPRDALRSRRSDLAQPRPLRAVQRPRVDAAVVAAASHRRQGRQSRVRGAGPAVGHARRHQALPPDRQPRAGPSRVPPRCRAWRRRPARSGRASRRAWAWRSRRSGSRRATTSPTSRSSTTTSTRSAATAA